MSEKMLFGNELKKRYGKARDKEHEKQEKMENDS
jgi:hypothetical protein